jgi:hypothetical protein
VIDGFFKLNVWSPSFAGIMHSNGKFNSVFVKMLNLVFYFSRTGVPLIKKINKDNKIVYQCGSFEPTLDPFYISLDNTFKYVYLVSRRERPQLDL